MHRPPFSRQITLTLVVATILLPIIITVLWGVSALLTNMGDTTGGCAFQRVALVVGVLWVVDLISLILAMAINGVATQGSGESDPEDQDEILEP